MNSSAFLSLLPLLCLAAPLAFGQAGPITVDGRQTIHYMPVHPCTLSGGTIPIIQNSTTITIGRLTVAEELSSFPAVATRARFRSPRHQTDYFSCNPGTVYQCRIDVGSTLNMSEPNLRPLLFDMSVGLAEMLLEFESGAPCIYRLSPEPSMSPRVEATVIVGGPSDTQNVVPGELRVSFAPSGCSDSIHATWRATTGAPPERFPLTLELDIDGVKCSYGQSTNSPESPVLKLIRPTAQPPSHNHSPSRTRLTGLSFSKPRQANGNPSTPLISVRDTP